MWAKFCNTYSPLVEEMREEINDAIKMIKTREVYLTKEQRVELGNLAKVADKCFQECYNANDFINEIK